MNLAGALALHRPAVAWLSANGPERMMGRSYLEDGLTDCRAERAQGTAIARMAQGDDYQPPKRLFFGTFGR